MKPASPTVTRKPAVRSLPGFLGAIVLSLLLLVAGMAMAEDEIHYRMTTGDTLIGLGQRALNQPDDWREIQRINQIANPYRIPAGTLLRIPARLLDPRDVEARIESVTGTATVDDRPAETGMSVTAGAALATGEQGQMTLRLQDDSLLTIPARSTVQLARLREFRGLDGLDVDLHVESGRLESQVNPRRGPSARYRIESPTAVIGVRGTEFRAAFDATGGHGTAEVLTGAIQLQQRSSGAELAVGEGFGVRVDQSDALPEPRPLLGQPPVAGLPAFFETPRFHIPMPEMEGATAWRGRIAATTPEAPILLDLETSTDRLTVDELPDGDYDLHLRAVDSHGIEGRDAVHRFRLKATPQPPFPSRPEESARMTEGPVSFGWPEPIDSDRFRLQLARGADFSQPILDEILTEPHFETVLAAGHYHWRLASIRGEADQGPWSAASGFEVRPRATFSGAPDIGNGQLRFRWEAGPGQRAEYRLATDPAFRNIVHAGDTGHESVELPVPPAGEYWLQLRVTDADGFVGPWSDPQRVTVPLSRYWWLPFALPLLILL